MFKVAKKFGFACGGILIGIFMLSKSIGVVPFIDYNQFFLDIVFFAVFVGFASREFKRGFNGGYLHFWQGMTVGFFVYAIAIVIFLIFLIAYFLIDVNALQDYQQAARGYYMSIKETFVDEFGQEAFEEALQAIEEASARQLLMSSILKKLFAAILVTPVMSIILRRKPD